MNKIKQFEAFKGKEVDAINKFLKSIKKEDSVKLIDMLSNIATKIDRPLSAFNGEYLPVTKAKTINKENLRSDSYGYLKIFFSVSGGVTLITKSNTRTMYYEDYLNEFLNKRGFVSENQLENLSSKINGKLVIVKDYKNLENDDLVVVKFTSSNALRNGYIYKEILENGQEDIFAMTNINTGHIPYMISPNEANKKIRAFDKAYYSMLSSNGNKLTNHTYLGLVEESDKPLYQDLDSITRSTSLFLEKNIPTSNLTDKTWNDDYMKLLESSDFALVLDLDKIISSSTSLRDEKAKRTDLKKGILPRIDDEYYKKLNKSKYNSKLSKGVDSEKEIILEALYYYIKKMSSYNSKYTSGYSSYDNYGRSSDGYHMALIEDLYFSYRDGYIDTKKLLDTLYECDPRTCRFIMQSIHKGRDNSLPY